mmetsp:Transcript_1071/g.2931  ORF Transcript_1071/g.2931 Transcript_1071/m.2931 type:complete len:285 (-) Transcript_1071:1259-2113(-)
MHLLGRRGARKGGLPTVSSRDPTAVQAERITAAAQPSTSQQQYRGARANRQAHLAPSRARPWRVVRTLRALRARAICPMRVLRRAHPPWRAHAASRRAVRAASARAGLCMPGRRLQSVTAREGREAHAEDGHGRKGARHSSRQGHPPEREARGQCTRRGAATHDAHVHREGPHGRARRWRDEDARACAAACTHRRARTTAARVKERATAKRARRKPGRAWPAPIPSMRRGLTRSNREAWTGARGTGGGRPGSPRSLCQSRSNHRRAQGVAACSLISLATPLSWA